MEVVKADKALSNGNIFTANTATLWDKQQNLCPLIISNNQLLEQNNIGVRYYVSEQLNSITAINLQTHRNRLYDITVPGFVLQYSKVEVHVISKTNKQTNKKTNENHSYWHCT